MKSEWILFTGSPGCGKTTAIQRLVDHIQQTTKQQSHHHNVVAQCTCRGFITREVRSQNNTSTRSNHNKDRNPRIGFDLVSVPDGHTYPLARILDTPVSNQAHHHPQRHQPKIGKYSVDVAALERIVLPALLNSCCIPESNTQPNNNNHADTSATSTIIVLDEIGKMELHSTHFRDAVQHLLQLSSSSSIRLIGTVPTRGKVPFCDDVCQHPFVKVYQLDWYNRDEIVNHVLRKIDTEWLQVQSK